MNEIGLFCGTFNPIHLGHLLIAECARDQFALSKVLFVTSPTPPHRSTGLLPGEQRHQLVQAAIQGNTRFEASRLELDRGGTSYTVDTVEQVLAAHSEPTRVNLIIGGDNLPFLKDWHRSQELLTLCRLIVVPRLRYLSEAQAEAQVDHGLSSQNRNQNQSQTSGHSQPGISQPGISQPGISQVVKTIAQTQPAQHHTFDLGHEFKVVDFPGIAISSSTIRKRIALNKTVLYMVPPAVEKLIAEHGYYKATEGGEPI